METISLTSVTVKPDEGVVVELKEGYEKYLVFYPVAEGSAGYLNMQFLDAEVEGRSFRGRNTDERYEHVLWIIQFNHPLPPIFKIAPWQILIVGMLELPVCPRQA